MTPIDAAAAALVTANHQLLLAAETLRSLADPDTARRLDGIRTDIAQVRAQVLGTEYPPAWPVVLHDETHNQGSPHEQAAAYWMWAADWKTACGDHDNAAVFRAMAGVELHRGGIA